MLELASIPIQTHWCTVRRLEDGYVVYNSRTDELHVLTPSARYAYELCDGDRTVEAISAILAGPATADEAHDDILGFLRALEDRGVIHDADG